MEVDKLSFYPLLLDILTDISEAHFVALDLELSGVPSKQAAKNGAGAGRPSLQERYLEVKEAAERYQILQIGLTCVQQDVENGKYILKPYNFELSPLIEERGLDVERIFSFQSGAVDFLLKAGFDMSVPFYHGVPYLSRAEAKEVREKHAKRQDKSAIANIQIKPTEVESLAFVGRVRTEIKAWMSSRSQETLEYVNTSATSTDIVKDNSGPPQDLSCFEKRLVHQLVRAEFPELVSIPKRGFIQVIKYNKEREESIAAGRLHESNERINRQKGFRWIIEALLGTEISHLDLRECAKSPTTGNPVFADIDDYKAQFHRAAALLRGNPRMLVGHNCFLDLVYIYRTFIGKLPDTVEEFARKIHGYWPLIVDTKYMSTHNCGDINPVSSLEQIAQQLSQQEAPTLEVDQEHKKYEGVEVLHEAGYDSFLTAQIAVRLSAKLEQEGTYVDFGDDVTAPGDEEQAQGKENAASGGVMQLLTKGLSGITNGINHGTSSLKLGEATASSADTGTDVVSPPPPSDVNGFTPSEAGAKWKRRGEPTLPPQDPADPYTYDPKNLKHRHHDPGLAYRTIQGGMPCLNSDFWRVYGNNLRVFGTEEGVCVLDKGEDGGVKV